MTSFLSLNKYFHLIWLLRKAIIHHVFMLRSDIQRHLNPSSLSCHTSLAGSYPSNRRPAASALGLMKHFRKHLCSHSDYKGASFGNLSFLPSFLSSLSWIISVLYYSPTPIHEIFIYSLSLLTTLTFSPPLKLNSSKIICFYLLLCILIIIFPSFFTFLFYIVNIAYIWKFLEVYKQLKKTKH